MKTNTCDSVMSQFMTVIKILYYITFNVTIYIMILQCLLSWHRICDRGNQITYSELSNHRPQK